MAIFNDPTESKPAYSCTTLLSNTANIITKATISGLYFSGRCIRSIVNPIFFFFGGYKPQLAAAARLRRIEKMREKSENLALLTDKLGFAYGKVKPDSLIAPTGFQWVINAERELVTTITHDVVVLIISNLLESSLSSKESTDHPVSSIIKTLSSNIQEVAVHPLDQFEKQMGLLLYRNNIATIPAPFPINQILFNDIHFYFGEAYISRLREFIAIDEFSQNLRKTESGRLLLKLDDLLSEMITESILANADSYKESIINALFSLIPDEDCYRLRNLKSWFKNEVNIAQQEGHFSIIYTFLKKWIHAIIIRTSIEIIDPKIREPLLKSLLENIIKNKNADQFANELMQILDIQNGYRIGLSKEFIIAFVPTIKSAFLQAGQFLITTIQETMSWHERYLKLKIHVSSDERKLVRLLTDKIHSYLHESLDIILEQLIAYLDLEDQEQKLLCKTLSDFLNSNSELAKAIWHLMRQYLEGIIFKPLFSLKQRCRKDDAVDEQMKLANKLLRYCKNFMQDLNTPTNRTTDPCEIISSLLDLLRIQEENLPVPSSLKKATWELLSKKILPNIMENLIKRHINRPFLEKKIGEYIRRQNQNAAQPSISPTQMQQAPNEMRGNCELILAEVLNQVTIPLGDYFINESQKQLIGYQLADFIYTQLLLWPPVKIHKKLTTVIISELESPEDTLLQEFQEINERTDLKEIHRFLVQNIYSPIRESMPVTARGMPNLVKKGVSKGLKKILKQATANMMGASINLVDRVTVNFQQTLFPDRQPSGPVELEGFTIIENYDTSIEDGWTTV